MRASVPASRAPSHGDEKPWPGLLRWLVFGQATSPGESCQRSLSLLSRILRVRSTYPGEEDAFPELAEGLIDEAMTGDVGVGAPSCNFEVGDNVVYPHHGAGVVVKKETKDLLGESRDYLTIQILHNSMIAMVPCENAHTAGLRRVIAGEQVEKVIGVLADEVSEMPQSWTRRFKHNREKIKTGDVYELAEVVRNLAIRESENGLSAGEKQMYTRAKKNLASEFMYALDKDEDGAESYLDELLQERFGARPTT
jgi:CarD family transcriptional regulator